MYLNTLFRSYNIKRIFGKRNAADCPQGLIYCTHVQLVRLAQHALPADKYVEQTAQPLQNLSRINNLYLEARSTLYFFILMREQNFEYSFKYQNIRQFVHEKKSKKYRFVKLFEQANNRSTTIVGSFARIFVQKIVDQRMFDWF